MLSREREESAGTMKGGREMHAKAGDRPLRAVLWGQRGSGLTVSALVLALASSSPCTAISMPDGFAPRWRTLTPHESPKCRFSNLRDDGAHFGTAEGALRPWGREQRRVCVAKAEAQKQSEFSLKAAFQKLPEAWRSSVINVWAATLAGLVAYTIATPIEAFKVGIQTWPGTTLSGIGRNILKTRGPLGFFNGLDAMLWAGLPYSIVMYGSYQPVKKFVNEKLDALGVKSGSVGQFLGAALGETLGMIVFIPGELVRMRMMNSPGLYKNFLQAVPTILKKEGVKSLFTGFGTTLARDVPYTALTFWLFESMRSEIAKRKPDGEVSFVESIAAGVATAIVCSTFTIPLDVVKSNVMTSTAVTLSVAAVAKDIYVIGGLKAFFKGYVPFMTINSFKWGSSMAVYGTAYEYYGGGSMGGVVH